MDRLRLHRATWSLLVATALLGGCSTGDGAPRPPTPPTETAATPSSPTDEPPDEGDDRLRGNGGCSAAGLTVERPPLDDVDEAARRTALELLEAALRCDDGSLIAVASRDDTELTFGGSSPDQMFALPERDTPTYEIVARLIARTDPARDEIRGTTIWVWPAVFIERQDQSNWDQVVDAGLESREAVQRMRASDEGYLGWRLGIGADGTWLFFVAGD